MRVFQKELKVRTRKLYDFAKITNKTKKLVNESKIKNGIIFINSLHTTTAIILQEDDRTVHEDLIDSLDRLFPENLKYKHNYEGNVNSTAHQKSNFLGNSVSVPLENNGIILGSWQDIFLVELFEPREREIVITIIGE